MISQNTITLALIARLTALVTAATNVTTDLLPDVESVLTLTLVPGGVERPRLTAQGNSSKFYYDALLYFKGTTNDQTDAALRTAMALAESQVADLVAQEGGNRNGWNSLDYEARSTNDQIQLMAEQLDAVRVIPLSVTVY